MARILIVDDSRVILSVVQTYLVGLKAEIAVASSAEQALERFAEAPADLVISDIQMPGMDGVELGKRLKQLAPEVKVLLISAAKKLEGSEAARRGSVDAFVPKPIDGDLLRRRVMRLLGKTPAPDAGTGPISYRPEPRGTRPIRVLAADDTEVGRRIIERILKADRDFEVVAVARDGHEAVDLALEHHPGLVLMDANMPKLDGLLATRRIMQEAPTRVIIVTEQYDPKSANAAFEATRAGALDLLQRPSWGDPSGPAATAFRERLKDLADVPVIGQRRPIESPRPREQRPVRALPPCEIVVIVASTGGPSVLATLLSRLGDDLDSLPFLVVQHLLEGFDSALVSWLSEVTHKSIRLARDGDAIEPGVLFAPDGRHLLVHARDRLGVSERPLSARHRPSGDLLLESAARAFGAGTVGVILTGMGDDGLAGARLVRAFGGSVLVQQPETCVVPGMPGAAIEDGVADAVLSPDEIADDLSSRIRGSV